jgi:phosphoglycerol transferase MdoB-like AlkP superfamily enzyme
VFLQLPFHSAASLQRITLILNTVMLIVALIVVELVYAEATKKKRAHLKLFIPLFVVLAGLLVFAVFKQVRAA